MDIEKSSNAFYQVVNEVIETYKDQLKPLYVVEILSQILVNIALTNAPNELEGIKAILSSLQASITDYEKNES